MLICLHVPLYFFSFYDYCSALFPFTFLSLITPAAAISSCSLNFSLSYYHCCCSVFLFHFTLLSLITPAAALSSCSPLLLFYLISLVLICLLVPLYFFSFYVCCSALFPFTFLSLITPAAAISSCSLNFSLSYYHCCCSVFLFPFSFLSLCIPCCSALFPLIILSPCCCSVFLLPLVFFLFCIPCCSAMFFFTLLYLITLLLLCLRVLFNSSFS